MVISSHRVQALEPEVVLVDSVTAEGIATVRDAVAALPKASVVALGVPEAGPEVIAWVEAGASAYSGCDADVDEFVAMLDSVVRGQVLCSPEIVAALLQRVAHLARGNEHRNGLPLTARQREVAALVEQGLSNKEIAARLYITVATAKNHVHRILEKLQVKRREDVTWRLRAGGYNIPRV